MHIDRCCESEVARGECGSMRQWTGEARSIVAHHHPSRYLLAGPMTLSLVPKVFPFWPVRDSDYHSGDYYFFFCWIFGVADGTNTRVPTFGLAQARRFLTRRPSGQ